MVHAGALPGTPHHVDPLPDLIRHAVRDAHVLAEAGFDALLLENMHDRPYLRRHAGPEITAAMTAVALALRAETGLPLGIQILAGANREALAVAHTCGASFIRAEGYVFAHLADEGFLQSDAGELLRYRKAIGAQSVRVFADIKKKHSSHAITADVDLAETARAAAFFSVDGLVVTGVATGEPTDPGDVAAVRAATNLPILVGSGVTPDTLPALWPHADSFIVGSWIKEDAQWHNPVDPARARRMVETAGELKGRGD